MAESCNAPLVLKLASPQFLRLPFNALPQPPAITCKASSSSVCRNQTSVPESFSPTMLANENDGGGEENCNETFQKSHTCLL